MLHGFYKQASIAQQEFILRRLVALLGLVLATSPGFAKEPAPFFGVIDAGSSGSRLYVYKFGADARSIEDVLEVASTGAPLASHVDQLAAAGDRSIGPMLRMLDRELSQRGISKADVEMHVLATGGMRLLAAPAAQAIEASVLRTLRDGGYQAGRIETISGEMEGFYAWLDVNVLLGKLSPGQTPASIVEIGGASMQVAYAGAPAGPGVVTASFGGATYSVRSVSFLGLGVDQARKTLMDSGEGGACYPTGVVSAMPDVSGARAAFDADRCAKGFTKVIGDAMRGLPRDEMKAQPFIGLGRPLSGVLTDWRLPQDRPAAMNQLAREKCVLPWAAFTGAVGNTPFTPYLCVNSIYLATLLFDASGFGFSETQMVAADRIAGRRPSWTRGAALMLRNP